MSKHTLSEESEEPTKRIKLANSSKWSHVPLRSVGVKLSDSVTAYTTEDLILTSIPQTSEGVFGLENIKQQMIESILMPLNSPHVYRIDTRAYGTPDASMGKIPLEYILAFYGARNSGKKTAIRTFCLEHSITLVEISYIGFRPLTDIDIAYEFAEKNMPAIVVFNECEGFFPSDLRIADPRTVGALHGWFSKIKQSCVPIWTVFVSTVVPGPEVFHHFVTMAISHRQWSGKLNSAARERALTQAINVQLWPGQRSPVSDSFMSVLKQVSVNCTVGQITDYIEAVFRHRTKIAVAHIALIDQTSDTLMPQIDDFTQCMVKAGRTQRITNISPFSTNVAPYSNETEDEGNHGWGVPPE